MKKLITLTLCLALPLTMAAGCGGNTGASSGSGDSAEAAYKIITPKEAYEMMEQSTDYIILDVRTQSEYQEIRINGSILIPHDEIAVRAEAELPDKGQLIFVYCRSGGRSETAAKALVDLGYTNVYDIGGIIDWPYETVSD